MVGLLEKVFSSSCKDNKRTYDNCTTGFLLDYVYLKNYVRMIEIDLSKQQALDSDPKSTQQIIFTGKLGRALNTIMFFII